MDRQQQPAGRFVDDYLAHLLARASALVSARFHARLADYGIGIAEWRVLASLSDGEGMSLGELARITLFKQPTLTKIIDRMAQEGFVIRDAAPGDRRRLSLHITGKGRALVDDLLVEAKAQEASVLSPFSDEEQVRVKAVLRNLIDRLEEG